MIFEVDVEGYIWIKYVYIRFCDGVELCVDIFLLFFVFKGGNKVFVIFNMGLYGKDVFVFEFGLFRMDMYVNMYKFIKLLGLDVCFELLDFIFWVSICFYFFVLIFIFLLRCFYDLI